MKVIWILGIVAIIGLNFYTTTGAPITKWFKTDNNTYYIETQQTFTWQQSYDACNTKDLTLLSFKGYNEDPLLIEYLKQSFETVPEFWLKSSDKVDMNNLNELLSSLITEEFLNIKLDGVNNAEIMNSENADNCALSENGTAKACETLHGFICKANSSSGCGEKNVQNIILKFN